MIHNLSSNKNGKYTKKFHYGLTNVGKAEETDLTEDERYGEDWSELEGKQLPFDIYSLEEMRDWYKEQIEDFIDDIYGDDCTKNDL